jgi:hypothetical protein
VYRITVVAITASAFTSVAFAGCREPAPIFRLNGCGGPEQIIYGSPAPYTAITKYTKYQGDHYGNQTYETEGWPPYPPYYPYPNYGRRTPLSPPAMTDHVRLGHVTVAIR